MSFYPTAFLFGVSIGALCMACFELGRRKGMEDMSGIWEECVFKYKKQCDELRAALYLVTNYRDSH